MGAGTAVDPWSVTTTVDLGDSGLRLTQTDTYIAGQQSYVTRVRLVNTGDVEVPVVVYRAGDCYVEDSDNGYGDASEGTVACVAESGRVAKWIPVTGGSAYMQATYSEVWSAIGSRQMFPNTTRGDEYLDNGAGLSWQVDVESGDDAEIAHVTAFSEDATTAGDADGDGLLDEWERDGLDVDGDGVPEVDLPAMGASPDHKDLFVEVDWMSDPRSCVLWWCWGGRDFAPQPEAIQDAIAVFAAAPVPNPDGTTGIRLHVDAGADYVMNPSNGALWGARSRASAVDHQAFIGEAGANGYDWTEFNALKAESFETARADVFHYAIFADRYGDEGSSGIAQISDSVWEGDSFLVTDGAFGDTGFSRRQESGTFMHEFGHTLGLRHGGGDHVNNKPNFQSIMSYFWQMGRRPLDFSRQALPIVDELALLEVDGLPGATGAYSWFCPGTNQRETSSDADATDWDCDGEVEEDLVSVDVNGDGDDQVHAGFDDWANLVYDGGAVGAFGVDDLNDQDPPLQFSPLQEASYDELRELDLLGAPGDGSVAVVGPYVLLPGASDQFLRLHVSNVGSGVADYRVGLQGVPGVEAEASITGVPAHATEALDIPVDSSALVPGTYDLEVTLSGPEGGPSLASATVPVLVPNLSDPDVLAQLGEIRDALRSPQPGLDEAIRHQAVDALTALVPDTLEVSVETSARCVVGRTVLTARVANDEGAGVSAEIATAYGTRSTASLEAGKTVLHAFTTRLGQVPAGEMAVTVSATVDGETVTEVIGAPYAASSCS
ncbi:zinc-dependent metalloprotease family protein [Georgenia sp. MJ206]|uniref:zinc-dependent metalloprotease family protein n=1 Tax=Georgenia wangjunii TaxID=3117730 RepID=UPI002F267CA4